MKILGIESTCDETSCAIVEDGFNILSNVVSSQIDIHAQFGGVVPELACRRHIETITPVLQEALTQASCTLDDIDLIGVAKGPGLLGALLIGINFAKALSLATDIPLIGINHIEAHLYAPIMDCLMSVQYPALGVILSGGHTQFVHIKEPNHYVPIGQTLDDAMGEAFDKVAKMLHLPYPGGPEIERLAKKGDPKRFAFKGGKVKNRPFDLSFSGLKTSVLYTLFGQNTNKTLPLSKEDLCDAAASFQHTAVQIIIDKLHAILNTFEVKSLIFGGGVTCNTYLKENIFKHFSLPIFWPTKTLSLDNAAMIAGLSFAKFQAKTYASNLSAQTRIPF
ncbi:MAG: tRNA N6-adenosine threonylcarbamoyltransferase [Chlamydiae bacterium]|nr:tRNA N6-adenosine threonylcarbamoyltransferase [Chlamydiota bacterium]